MLVKLSVKTAEPKFEFDTALTPSTVYADLAQVYIGPEQLIWGTGYPFPRWELPMDKELEFVDKYCSFYTEHDKDLLMGKNALKIWNFPK